MKKVLFPLSFVLSVLASLAQSPDHAWTKQISGTLNETATDVNIDASGNIYTVGYFEGLTDFDPGPGTYTMMSSGAVSMFIQKLDPQGNFLWARQVSQLAQIAGSFARPTEQAFFLNGDICVSGYFKGLYDFDPGPGNALLYAQIDGAFAMRMDGQGNHVWSKYWGNQSNAMVNAVVVDPSDNVYTTGFFMDTLDFDPSNLSTFNVPGNAVNSIEAFISKLDGSGNFVWAKKLGTSLASVGYDINVDYLGNVYSTGTFDGTSDFDPNAGTQNQTSAGDQDIYVWKLDASGNFLWAKTMGGAGKESGLTLMNDASGNSYVGGFFNGTADLDPGPGTFNVISAGKDDMYILKLDATGNLLWAKAMGGTETDVISCMAMDANGSIYSTGQFADAVDFNPGPGTNTLSCTTRGNPFILKLDNQGNFTWVKQITGTDYAGGSAITLDASKNVYSVGIFSVTADFDPNAGVYNLTSAGDVDAYLHKMVCTEPPSIGASSTQTLLCEGNSATLTPTGATTYSWNSVQGTTHVVSPLVNTTYTLTGKDANGCTATAQIEQLVSKCTSIKEFGSEVTIKVYPNPNNGSFTVETGKPLQVRIVNLLGKVVYSAGISGSEQITLQQLPAGIYFLQNTSTNEVIKIVKN